MEYVVKKGFVKHEGVLYPKGSFFDAPASEVQDLINKGTLVPRDETPDDFSLLGGAGLVNIPDDTGDEHVLPSVEEFGKLKAPAQKDLLLELGIDPDSSAEERVAQYMEYYENL